MDNEFWVFRRKAAVDLGSPCWEKTTDDGLPQEFLALPWKELVSLGVRCWKERLGSKTNELLTGMGTFFKMVACSCSALILGKSEPVL